MPTVNITLEQLREAIQHLDWNDFNELNRSLDDRRRQRLKAIVRKARQNATNAPVEEAERIIEQALMEARAELSNDRRA